MSQDSPSLVHLMAVAPALEEEVVAAALAVSVLVALALVGAV